MLLMKWHERSHQVKWIFRMNELSYTIKISLFNRDIKTFRKPCFSIDRLNSGIKIVCPFLCLRIFMIKNWFPTKSTILNSIKNTVWLYSVEIAKFGFPGNPAFEIIFEHLRWYFLWGKRPWRVRIS